MSIKESLKHLKAHKAHPDSCSSIAFAYNEYIFIRVQGGSLHIWIVLFLTLQSLPPYQEKVAKTNIVLKNDFWPYQHFLFTPLPFTEHSLTTWQSSNVLSSIKSLNTLAKWPQLCFFSPKNSCQLIMTFQMFIFMHFRCKLKNH